MIIEMFHYTERNDFRLKLAVVFYFDYRILTLTLYTANDNYTASYTIIYLHTIDVSVEIYLCMGH